MNAQPAVAWSDLQLLLAVASNPSLLAAARRLGVDASTMSRRMTKLEASLGRKLLLRGPGGVRLTPAGEALAAPARAFEQDVARVLRGAGDALRGLTRVTAGAGFGEWLVPVVDEFLRANPRAAVDLVLEERVADLPRFEADLGLRVVHGREGSLVYEKLGELSYGLFASDEYLRRAGSVVRAADLSRHRLIGQLPPYDRTPQERELRAIAPVASSLRTTFPGQLAAVRRGVGIAALPTIVATGLVRLLPRVAFLPMPLWLAWHRESRDRPEVRALAGAIRERARRTLRVFSSRIR